MQLMKFVFSILVPILSVPGAFLAMSSVHSAELNSALTQRIQALEISAEQGQPEAQFELGNLYIIGGEVTVDLEKTLYWFTLAGEQSNFNAQYNLGVMYMNGQGVESCLFTLRIR